MEVQEKVVERDNDTGTTRVMKTEGEVLTDADLAEAHADKKNQVVWYIVGVIEVLLALRLIFHLLGARTTGFTSFIYNLSDPLVAPFRGIFPAPRVEGAYFDTATIVAMIIIALIGWGISALIDVANRPARPTRTL